MHVFVLQPRPDELASRFEDGSETFNTFGIHRIHRAIIVLARNESQARKLAYAEAAQQTREAPELWLHGYVSACWSIAIVPANFTTMKSQSPYILGTVIGDAFLPSRLNLIYLPGNPHAK